MLGSDRASKDATLFESVSLLDDVFDVLVVHLCLLKVHHLQFRVAVAADGQNRLGHHALQVRQRLCVVLALGPRILQVGV